MQIEKDQQEAAKRTIGTGQAFLLRGWVPAALGDKVSAELQKLSPTCSVEIYAPAEDDEPPILLHNGKFATPFESVVEGFALPSPKGMDPTAVMAPFYALLFGMMLSDAGYGLVMVLGCGIILHKFKNMEEGLRKTLTMFLYCGISTIFWGILFGSFFGDAITVIAKTFFNTDIVIPPLWFTPGR